MFPRARTRKCVKDTSMRMHGLAPQLTETTWHGFHRSDSHLCARSFLKSHYQPYTRRNARTPT